MMTGQKNGLTGQFLRHNPHLLNTHCSAHRVALCSEQAAGGIPGNEFSLKHGTVHVHINTVTLG